MLVTSVQHTCSPCLIVGGGRVEMASGGSKENIGLGKEKVTRAWELKKGEGLLEEALKATLLVLWKTEREVQSVQP